MSPEPAAFRLAREVHLAPRPRTALERFTDQVEGRPDGGDHRTPVENFAEFAAECQRLIRRKYDNVVVIDGFPRKGKSTLGIQLARAIDPRFGVNSIAYTAAEVIALYRKLPEGSVILNDESALGLLGRAGKRDPELEALIQALSIVGIKRITLICCLPNIWMLDSFVRAGRARFWINVYARGRGKLHRAHRGAHYKRTSELWYDSYDDLNPIGFPGLGRTAFWKEYEVHKRKKIDDWLREHELDPEGRVAICPDCGKKGSKYQIAIHNCPVRDAAAGSGAAPGRAGNSVDVPLRGLGGPPPSPPPRTPAVRPRRWPCRVGDCGDDFSRPDARDRHERSVHASYGA
ncbi:MAG TPA: hypothetical protein VGV89_10380 [Thermoplasmata archaeon]|nr:hypothetical protein [Thermoplasmata archaeon]